MRGGSYTVISRINTCLAGVGIMLLVAACDKKDDGQTKPASAPFEISVAEVEKRDVPRTVEFVGQTKGAVDAEVRARIEGVILSIHFEEGKEVSEGQLLYTIDPAPFEAKMAEAKAKLAEADTRLAKAESDLKRIRPLANMNAVSKRDLDAAIAQDGTARAAVDAAKAAVQSAEIELGYAKVAAPVSGLIGLSKAKVGEFVGRSPNPIVLTTVSKLDPILVRFSVNEKDYLYFARLRQKRKQGGEDQKKRELDLILADDSVHIHKGEIVSAEGQIDATTGSLTVEAAFPNPEKILRPGQFAKIRTVGETVAGVTVIPKRAVKELQGQYRVFVVGKDNVVESRSVKLGGEVGNMQLIESGLSEKERVAVDGFQRLKSGVVVSAKLETESNQ